MESRKYNRLRLAQRANEQNFRVGDSCITKANERLTLTTRYDPVWTVTRVRGPVLFLYQQQTGKSKVLNKSKVLLIDSAINWDEVKQPRPVRIQHRPAGRVQPNLPGVNDIPVRDPVPAIPANPEIPQVPRPITPVADPQPPQIPPAIQQIRGRPRGRPRNTNPPRGPPQGPQGGSKVNRKRAREEYTSPDMRSPPTRRSARLMTKTRPQYFMD